ncbi:tRNA (adenosine(37)-N6)-threonylcarbamoyltransferase complex dimerization subunit type 1 TsaB [Silanimonas sp.]|uniref:tRNA (adenosine(37)-N6)-threonylcarbamoyltransferase complex dimerization subunit type 1 TsaB n=1 Tax=Silanimonas sp. TaxID=1929290 RepID=UPI001BC446BA|nr:tRNA (adenosine(37)-N6)-threonylcarbamoyltransferase complex dimerization subunit type 1 TsaB [Silanimonas sp.]MBS3895286.1 tRNA (adenosine(37)-N6)-threonylcarbamoyltransferase complex dimerization subunit type 1 TsaB [Silanimonas sp.]MBS3923730.1 tRNA (adenosine(37)-N6)-threonylcarbamoyltransferase complex dimerization subunit type 1 TsaB [Xanthomonadaceae bacterium]
MTADPLPPIDASPPGPPARPAEGGPTLLAFELATEACSVALLHAGRLLARHELAPRRHAELALPWADALLAEAGLAKSRIDALAVGIGPGAFTGVRLAISLVQGIALGLDRPVLPVSTLAALAEPFLAEGPVLAAIDARMGELYLAAFRAGAEGLPEASGDPRLLPLAAAGSALAGPWAGMEDATRPSVWQAVGSGFAAGDRAWWAPWAARFGRVLPAALPTASAVARIARRDWQADRAVAAAAVEPAYLRDKVALTTLEQQAARALRGG